MSAVVPAGVPVGVQPMAMTFGLCRAGVLREVGHEEALHEPEVSRVHRADARDVGRFVHDVLERGDEIAYAFLAEDLARGLWVVRRVVHGFAIHSSSSF